MTASISEETGVTAQIIPVGKSENLPHATRVGERATRAASYTTVVSRCYCVGVIYIVVIVGVGGWLKICSQCIGAYLVVVSCSIVDEDVVIVIRSRCIEAYRSRCIGIEVRGGSTSQARFLKPGKYSH